MDLRNKYITVKNKEELVSLFKYAEKKGFKFSSGDRLRDESCFPKDFPNTIHFWKDYTVTYGAETYNRLYWSDIKDITEMSAREFLEKFIKHMSCAGRMCEECILSNMNTKNGKTMCESINWKEKDIDCLIRLANTDDSIYHPPMDDVRAALCIDDILGKFSMELDEEEEKALEYAANKLREVEK